MTITRKLLTVCCVGLMASALTAGATTVTMTLESTNAGVFPYQFDIKTGSVTQTGIDLACLNDNRSVTIGESWTATEINLETLISTPGYTGSTKVDGSAIAALEADAYLDSLFGTSAGSDTEIQDAIWDILNPGSKSLDTTAQGLWNTADKIELGTITETASFYSQFTFYYPTSWTGGEPQQFMGYTPAPAVPEPSSLLLLGTGMAGFAGMLRRRVMASRT